MNEWGYETDAEPGALISAADFAAYTGGRLSAPTEQVEAVLDSVSAAVRSWCGWHVSPLLGCEWTGDADGRLVRLPCMCVASVESVEVGGRELPASGYEWRPSGLVRLAHSAPDEWGCVRVRFAAGAQSYAIGAAVAQVAANALVATPGIREEHAGQVGASYNQTGDGVSGGITLLERDRDMLAAWRLPML